MAGDPPVRPPDADQIVNTLWIWRSWWRAIARFARVRSSARYMNSFSERLVVSSRIRWY